MATVTGTLQNALSAEIAGQVTVQLCGYGAMVPRANGVALFGNVSTLPTDIPVGDTGIFNFEVTGNDEISPAGTYYTVAIADANGDVVQVNAYQFLGTQSYDLNLIDPFDPTQPLPPLPPLITNLLDVVSVQDPVFDGSQYTAFQMLLTASGAQAEFVNMVPGNLYTFILDQDGTGGRTFEWPANAYNGTFIMPTPNSRTIQTFVADESSNLYAIGAATLWP
jgi:hypothetical protein